MGKSRMSTCKFCGEKIPTEDKLIYSSKTCCKKCYDIKIENKRQHDELLTGIMQYFNIEKPTGLILKQLKQFADEFGYTYGGMKYTLYYITGVLQRTLELKYGIALVKYEYENAMKYYEDEQKRIASVSKVKEEMANKVISKKPNVTSRRDNSNWLLNLDELANKGDD